MSDGQPLQMQLFGAGGVAAVLGDEAEFGEA
jgi:hypothetical protein